MEPQAGPVGVDPPAEPTPTPDQGFVGHFHRGLAGVFRVGPGRDQAGVGQAADDGLDGLGVGAGRDELAERRPPLGVLGPFPRLHQAQEKPLAQLLVLGWQVAIDLVGAVVENPLDAPLLAPFIFP